MESVIEEMPPWRRWTPPASVPPWGSISIWCEIPSRWAIVRKCSTSLGWQIREESMILIAAPLPSSTPKIYKPPFCSWTFLAGFAMVLLLIPIAAGIAFVEYRDTFPSKEAEQPKPSEQSQPESPVSSETERSMDETWAAAVAQDASPSLAVPGETIAFSHRIALTFDDGPDPATTPAILDVLRDYHVKGTFFVIGARAEQHPELIDRIVSEGHTLGNHTYYHRDLTKLTPELVSRELQDTQAVIDEVLGEHSQITLFRPPCGAPYITQMERLPVFQEAMREQRLYPVMWTIDSRDWALENQPESIVDNLAQSTPEDGGVVLLHDTQPQTVEALPKVIERYSAAGL